MFSRLNPRCKRCTISNYLMPNECEKLCIFLFSFCKQKSMLRSNVPSNACMKNTTGNCYCQQVQSIRTFNLSNLWTYRVKNGPYQRTQISNNMYKNYPLLIYLYLYCTILCYINFNFFGITLT